MKLLPFIFLSLLVLVGCHRKEFKTYVGNYDCVRSVTNWTAGETTEYIITPEHVIEVVREKKIIEILGQEIHIDSISPDVEYYSGNSENHFTVRFSNDSLFFYNVSSTTNGGTSYEFRGAKIDD